MRTRENTILMSSVCLLVLLMFGTTGVFGAGLEMELSCTNPGTGTPGYWRNHPEEWPPCIEFCGSSMPKAVAIDLMELPVKGDKSLTLFSALVAAKLNALIDNDTSCVSAEMSCAESWLCGNLLADVKGSSAAWKEAEPWYQELDAYNNGQRCAPSRDTLEKELSCTNPGTGTPGYWKNHPEEWPDEIEFCGSSMPKAVAVDLMEFPVKGDKSVTLFSALVAAKLNALIDNDTSCVSAEMSCAESWLCCHLLGDVKGSSAAWKEAEPWYQELDAYNNGQRCAPSRDTLEMELSCTNPGTGTPGYWKNHPQAWEPFTIINFGSGFWVTREEAIAMMGLPVAGDKTLTLFSALVAAHLNQYIGNDIECILSVIEEANAWIVEHRPGTGVKASSTAWKEAEPLYLMLDDYNNGRLCAPSRDSLE